MKTFLRLVAITATAEAVLFGVAWLVINCSSHAREIGLCMIYAFGILTAMSMGCMAMDPDSKIGKSLFSLLFVAIYFAMQSLTICTMLR